MKINGLYLHNFRNYSQCALQFPAMVNIFYGKNAQGKTNLLEALFYAAFGMSHRTSQEDDLFEKIVTRNRGGFCFELNGSFGWLLRELGYEVTDYFARYLRGESSIPMRWHRVLKVLATDGVYLADVGIGEICPREPLKLEEGMVQEQLGESYRLEKEDIQSARVSFEGKEGEIDPGQLAEALDGIYIENEN